MSDVAINVYGFIADVDAPAYAAHIRFSTNYATTWTAEDKFTDGSSVTGFPVAMSGMCVVIEAPNGNLITLHTINNIGTQKSVSVNGGKTWSAPANISISGLTAAENDHAFAVDQAVVVGSEIYVTTIYQDGPTAIEYLIKSTDNGGTWALVGQIGGADIGEVGITYIGDNTFCAVIRDSGDILYHTFSFNMGATWTAPEAIGIVTGGRPRLYTRSQLKGLANWWLDPVLIMCGFVNNGGGRDNVIWISENAGGDWSAPYVLETGIPGGGGYGGYGDMMYNKNTGEYVVVISYGDNIVKQDIRQYNVRITGI